MRILTLTAAAILVAGSALAEEVAASDSAAWFATDANAVKTARLDGGALVVGETVPYFENGQDWTPLADGELIVTKQDAATVSATFRIDLEHEEIAAGEWRAAEVHARNRYEVAAKTRAQVPDAEAFAAKGVDTAAYQALFRSVATEKGAGVYSVAVVLKDEALADAVPAEMLQQILDALPLPASANKDFKIAFTLEGGTPGLYYSVQGADSPAADEATWFHGEWKRDLCGADGRVEIVAPFKPGSQFYRVKLYYKATDTESAN